MTFDNTTWNVAQPITLSGVEDYLIDGNQSSTISYTLSSTDTTEPFHNAYGSFSASVVDSGTQLLWSLMTLQRLMRATPAPSLLPWIQRQPEQSR